VGNGTEFFSKRKEMSALLPVAN